MSDVRITAVAHGFGRDLDRCLADVSALIDSARADGTHLLVLPEASLGGYLHRLSPSDPDIPPNCPPALALDSPEVRRVARLAGDDLVVCLGICEADGDKRYNTAICVHDGEVLGVQRKVHLPQREDIAYGAGDRFEAFDTPVGRMGLLICYDKMFPESGRSLAIEGADIVACLSAWPASRTKPGPTLAEDRWTKRFDLLDRAGALHNQVVWVSSNQTGRFGELRFVGSAKVVEPGGEVLATTGTEPGVATATLDVARAVNDTRRIMSHLRDRRPDAYGALGPDGEEDV
jgi:N-carbamoylputrescine amidase